MDVIAFSITICTRGSTRTREGLSFKLEGFDSFGVGSFDYPSRIKNNNHNINQLIINCKFNKNYGTKLLKGYEC